MSSNTDPAPVSLSLADYDFDLPADRIAEVPASPRDRSRLLVVDRETGSRTDSHFVKLAEHLRPGDLLVVNNTRVLKARLLGTLERTGRPAEILFANPLSRWSWEGMLHPGRRAREGDRVILEGDCVCEVGPRLEDGLRIITLADRSGPGIEEVLEAHGHVPLPPYIGRKDRAEDELDYQTLYAKEPGAIAAPTAGLHFSDAVFTSLEARGVETVQLTLHVGVGTFIPVRTDNPIDHRIRAERFEISQASAEALNRARAQNRRIIAVGTTTTRALEHVYRKHGRFVHGAGETDLYILPGCKFAAIDGLLTNFHLPRSTLLLLVCAFASRDLVLDSYSHAIDHGYRFYSYGDCSLFV